MEYLKCLSIKALFYKRALQITLLSLMTIGGVMNSCYAQLSTTPNSIYLGFEGGEIQDDTLFVWDKVRGHMRSGRFDAGSSNFIDVGYFSHSFGDRNIASGEGSFAANIENIASGKGAVAFGQENHAASGYSALFGKNNKSFHFFETIVGKYNRIAVQQGAVPLFTVGNGGTEISRKNAFIVTDDNYVGIGDIDPVSNLHIVHDNRENSGLRIENTIDDYHWRLFVGSGTNDNLALFHHSLAGIPVGVFDAAGGYGAPSDIRLKNAVSELQYGLSTVLQLNPVSYHFNHIKSDQKRIGFIAQEVIDIIPEAVNYNAEEDQYQMYYDSFGPVAIKAIQELHEIIERQGAQIEKLNQKVNELSLSKK